MIGAILVNRRIGMRRLRLVGARPKPHRASVNAIGAQARHTGMVGERADLLMAGLARNAVAKDQGMSRPGPPLPVLVGPAEQDDRERARRRRQMSRAGIRADEEVGPLEQGGRLRDCQARPSSRAAGRAARGPERADASSIPPTTTTRQPLSRNARSRPSTTP